MITWLKNWILKKFIGNAIKSPVSTLVGLIPLITDVVMAYGLGGTVIFGYPLSIILATLGALVNEHGKKKDIVEQDVATG